MNDRNAPQNITYYSKIQDLIFSVRSQDEIKLDSSVNVISKEIMRSDGPASDGLYDKRMGTTDIAWECPTCNNRKTICPGHFGSINLRYPVKSPLFRDILLQWLKSICHTCGLPIVTLSKKSTACENFKRI
jgi:DNA-directed RNA polymerase beta' subunit